MAGIYIHIPFCKQACNYCDFHFSTTYQTYRGQLVESLALELERRKNYLQSAEINTIYFGGGTPSLLSKTELQKILNFIYKCYPVSQNIEITLEANPDDLTVDYLKKLKRAGINRLSIGVQSFDDTQLSWMNRAHNGAQAKEAVLLAKKIGFDVSIDLIYGTPNLTLDKWKETLQKFIEFEINHLSAYCLTIETNTPLYHQLKKGKTKSVSTKSQITQYEMMLEILEKHHFEQYEISNFAHKNKIAKHNTNYWNGIPYLGIGPSAHSYDGKSRAWNIKNNLKYINAINQQEAFSETEILTKKDQFNEMILTRLRTKWGVDLQELNEIMKIPKSFHKELRIHQKSNLIYQNENTIFLTKQGRLLADRISSELFI